MLYTQKDAAINGWFLHFHDMEKFSIQTDQMIFIIILQNALTSALTEISESAALFSSEAT